LRRPVRAAAIALIAAVVPGAAALAPGAGGAASARGALAPRHNGPIAFVRYKKQRFGTAFPRIFLMDPDGSHQHRVSPSHAEDGDPAFSPSGTRVAFDHQRHGNDRIAIMHRDGSHRRTLTRGFDAFAPSFAPSGRRIAFYGFAHHNNADIYTISTHGTHLRRLTRARSLDETPAFSPTGKLIAFESLGGQLQDFGVVVMRADGTHRRVLDRNGLDPSFSPNGKKIIYGGDDPQGLGQLFTIHPDGTHRRQLTDNHGGRLEYANPAYSPNGKRIVFERSVVFRNAENDDIFTIRADGSHLERLTRGGVSLEPSWGVRR
jgi:TolB protein